MPNQEAIAHLLLSAATLLASGDIARAEQVLNQVLDLDIYHPVAWQMLYNTKQSALHFDDFKLAYASEHFPKRLGMLLTAKAAGAAIPPIPADTAPAKEDLGKTAPIAIRASRPAEKTAAPVPPVHEQEKQGGDDLPDFLREVLTVPEPAAPQKEVLVVGSTVGAEEDLPGFILEPIESAKKTLEPPKTTAKPPAPPQPVSPLSQTPRITPRNESTPSLRVRFCPVCGTPVRQGVRFCSSCGEAISARPADSIPYSPAPRLSPETTAASAPARPPAAARSPFRPQFIDLASLVITVSLFLPWASTVRWEFLVGSRDGYFDAFGVITNFSQSSFVNIAVILYILLAFGAGILARMHKKGTSIAFAIGSLLAVIFAAGGMSDAGNIFNTTDLVEYRSLSIREGAIIAAIGSILLIIGAIRYKSDPPG